MIKLQKILDVQKKKVDVVISLPRKEENQTQQIKKAPKTETKSSNQSRVISAVFFPACVVIKLPNLEFKLSLKFLEFQTSKVCSTRWKNIEVYSKNWGALQVKYNLSISFIGKQRKQQKPRSISSLRLLFLRKMKRNLWTPGLKIDPLEQILTCGQKSCIMTFTWTWFQSLEDTQHVQRPQWLVVLKSWICWRNQSCS